MRELTVGEMDAVSGGVSLNLTTLLKPITDELGLTVGVVNVTLAGLATQLLGTTGTLFGQLSNLFGSLNLGLGGL